jgi:hypothetical protein
LPTRSAEATAAETTTAETTTAEATSAEPTTPEATSEPETVEPTRDEARDETEGAQEAGGSPTAEATSSAAAEAATGSEEDNTTLLIALLVLLALAAATAAFMILRRRAVRRGWAAAFDTARRESERLARDVLPALVSESRESRRGGWAVARPGFLALEDQLAGLARSAADEHLRADADGLRDALSQVRQSIDDEVRASGLEADSALGAARQAARRLDERLAAVTSPTDRASA